MARDPMPARRRINPALVCGLVGITILVVVSKSMIGVLGLLFLAVKLVLSARRPTAPRTDCSVDGLRVVVLVPMYNEDPEIIRRSIRSLLNQTHVPDRIHVIDDGSNSPDALDAVKDEVRNERTRVRLSRHRFNLGKRDALATAAQMERDADIFVTVDSDTVLDPGAIAALLGAFRDQRVLGATALGTRPEPGSQHPHPSHRPAIRERVPPRSRFPIGVRVRAVRVRLTRGVAE